jgi:hypothetical protein
MRSDPMNSPDDRPCPTCGEPVAPDAGGWPDTPDGPRYCSAHCAAVEPQPRLRIHQPREDTPMTRQPDLFAKMLARVRSRQLRLFDPADVAAGDCGLACGECGRLLVRTASSYLCCPAGHGRLLAEVDDRDRSGSWFDDDPPDAA